MASASLLLLACFVVGAVHARSPLLHADLSSYAADTEEAVVFNDSGYRLSGTTVPRHYVVSFSVDLTTFSYAGNVTIHVAARHADVNVITLHSQELTDIWATVTYNGVNVLQFFTLDNNVYRTLNLNLNTAMAYNATNEQLYAVNILFQGSLRTDNYGFYRSWYMHNNQVRWMATTQFQAMFARAAFPCYDEPSYKATFDISIERPNAYTSWSNMRLQSSVPAATTGRIVDTFYRTPVMSTYLLAFIVAEYDTLEVRNNQGELTYEVIARPNAIANEQGDYALDLGQRLLTAMDAHTGFPFASMDPNIKMTQAAIPDLSTGTMGNWGLLTYREQFLMHDEAHTTNRHQQLIANFLSQEIAHMWFGNLVTCDWWNVLWLNEGFARYYQYFLTHWVEEQMGFETRFITEQVHTALLADSADSAHALTAPWLDSPASVSNHFSVITYNKGAAIIRMIEHLLGFEVHRQGIQNYLRDRSFKTATPSDLFRAYDAVGNTFTDYGFTTAEYYKSWTEKAGYPILNVHVNHRTGDMTIEQRRFERNTGYSSINSTWIIPLTFASAGNPDFSDTRPTHTIRDAITVINRGTTGDQWTIFNKQQTGFYRVNYDDYTWDLITDTLRGPQRILIHEYNRAQIVDDVFQLARAGLMSYTRAFNILSFLEFETDYAPWDAAINGYSWLRRRLVGSSLELSSLEYIFIGWATILRNRLGFEPIPDEPWMDAYLRSRIAPVLCEAGSYQCFLASVLPFAELRDNAVEIHANSRTWAYCRALQGGTYESWAFLWNRFQNHPVYTEKVLLLEALGCTDDPTALNEFLDGINNENTIIRSHNYQTAMNSAINGNEANTLIAFQWIQNNYHLLEHNTPNTFIYLNLISSRLLNEAAIQEFENWVNFNQGMLGNNYWIVINGIASARQLMAWANSIAADVVEYNSNGYQNLERTTPTPLDPVETPIKYNDYRLPGTTAPRNYVLRVNPDFSTLTNNGEVSIEVAAMEAGVNVITLQCQELEIISASVIYNNVDVLRSYALNYTHDFLYISLNNDMVYNAVNEEIYTANIVFRGALRTDMLGFYRSWYMHGDEVRWMATTQFAPTSARAAFPCYDEPGYKATFDMIIERPNSYNSWSNMRLQGSVPAVTAGRTVDTFFRTPVMSAYLLAFIVAEYNTVQVTNDQGQITHEVIARPNAIDQNHGAYALDLSQRLVAAMDIYTGIEYSSMAENIKMTQASIPDFSFGAMENWGLATYREASLMYDPAHTNSRFQERIITILSHEITHMWFGNLVTCDWWDVLWLNEGFARYYQYFLTSLVEDRMGFETRFIIEQVHTALMVDSIDSAHPLTDPRLDSPASVLAHFSTISYNKGATILRMTEHLLGHDDYHQGTKNYIRERAYKTAVPSDLFSAYDAVGDTFSHYGFTIDTYYRGWTEKAGYPVLDVQVNHQTGDMTIQQRRFNRDTGYSSIDSTWIVPINFASAENPDFSDTKPTHTIRDPITVINRGTTGDQWTVFNKQQTGFYRVNYDDYTWGLITDALRSGQRTHIHEYNRAQIVDDVFQLPRAGLMSYTRALNILSFLEFEADYAPWAAAISGFNWLRRRFVGSPQLTEIDNMMAVWSTNLISDLGYYPIADEPWMRSYLRQMIAPVLCAINVPACRTAATLQFAQLRGNGVEVPVDSRNWVYCNALRDGTPADFTFLWDRFQNHPVYTEKILLLETLGCTPHADSLATLLNGITANNYLIREQDYGTAITSAINGNEANTLIVLSWIQDLTNFSQFTAAFPNFAVIFNSISARLLTDAEIQAFETWLINNQILFDTNAYNSVLNGIASARQLRVWTTGITPAVVDYVSVGYQGLERTTPMPLDPVETPIKYNDYRLPGTTAPRNYVLRVNPDFNTLTNNGEVTIEVAAMEAGVNVITLQCQELEIISASVIYNNVDVLRSYALNYTHDFLYISLNNDMVYNAANEEIYTVNIAFRGALRTDMLGFYRSWYMHGDEVRWMATTQFAPTSARAAFPCYDEPGYKATFDMIIERPNSYNSWSNMRLQGSVPAVTAGRTVDTFFRTPVMSAYLLAFIVAEYDTVQVTNDQGQITHEVIARPNAIDQNHGAYALDLSQRLVAAMDIYTGIEYSSMAQNIKMTQASIPDFSFGAMENWGLATYREAFLMYDPAHTNSRFQERIITILSHEITHMWFGNLVTCEWWDVLWLNEGFARYYQYFLTSLVEDRMGFETRFITEQVHSSLQADSIDSAHPLTDRRLHNPASILAHFSTISYNKGATVIRMTEHLLGHDVHHQGIQNYLKDRKYSTAVPFDLFSALDNVGASSGALAQYGPSFTIVEYYRSWTEQPGYPLLYIHINHETGDMTIEQRRFHRDSGYSSMHSIWIIPITFASAGSPDFSDTKATHILRDTVTVINRGTTGDQWIIFNKQQTGFYRVNYDDYTWGLITLALRSDDQRTLIHEYNKAQIVDDVFQLPRAGLMSYTRALNILSFLEFEADYAPWAAAISGFNWLRRRFVGSPQLIGIDNMMAGWSTNLISDLGYYPIADEPWMRSYLRQMIAPVLCAINVPACRTAATLQFAQLRDNGVEVPVDSRNWVYCNALRDGTPADFTFLWERFQNHPVYTEKILLLETLGCTPHADSLATFLDAITADNNLIREQDYGTAMTSAINGNEANTLIVLSWIQDPTNWLQYASAFSNVADNFNLISARMFTDNDLLELEIWTNNNQAALGADAHSSVLNGIASTRQLRVWTNGITPDVVDYINVGYQPLEPSTESPEEPTDPPSTILPPEVEAPEVPEPDDDSATSLATSSLTLLLAFVAATLAAKI